MIWSSITQAKANLVRPQNITQVSEKEEEEKKEKKHVVIFLNCNP